MILQRGADRKLKVLGKDGKEEIVSENLKRARTSAVDL
jgi:hypothetical protein